MADDLEQAIILAYDPGAAVDPSFRAQAVSYCDSIRRDQPPPALVAICLERLSRAGALHPVRFWFLQSLHDCLPSLPPSELPVLLSSLLSLSSSSSSPFAGSPPFLKNKLSQSLASLITLHYPHSWPEAFLDLLSRLSDGPHAIDMFLRLLVALDDDLLSQDYPREGAALAAATRVKDAMRQQCVPQVVRALFDIASAYRAAPEAALAVAALDALRRYIPWIDISLVANDTFLPLLFDLLDLSDPIGVAAAECLLAVVTKRMDTRPKLTHLRSLQLKRLFSSPGISHSIAGLITGYASEVLACYKKLSPDSVDGSSSMELLEEALPSVFYVIRDCEDVESLNVVEFLTSYVSTMRPSTKQLAHVGHILEVVKQQMLYDPAYRNNLALPDKIGREEEDQTAERRRDLFALFRSVYRVAPDVTQLFVRNLLANTINLPETNVEEAEAALSLFYRLGEAVTEEDIKSGNMLLGEIVTMLLSGWFSCHSHRLVALVYLDTITRYMKFVQENTQYIPHVLTAFLDERGIHHPNLGVSRRASYLFMRAVKLLKAKLLPFIDKILQGLQDAVSSFTSFHCMSSGSEDGSHTFEAIGLLIGMEEVPIGKQSEYLSTLLTPLCQQAESILLDMEVQKLGESSEKIFSIQQTIMAIIALSKGFSERLVNNRPAIGTMFKQTLDVLLRIFVQFPRKESIRTKVTSFLHRMIEILGVSIFPYLPLALKQLMESEPTEMVDFILLINQLICKFGASIEGMLVEIFPDIASRLFHILPSNALALDSGCHAEDTRELQELQRSLYTLLHVIVTHNLSSVFLAPKCMGYLDGIMQSLLFTSCNHKDILVRKQCVQIFVRLVKDWSVKFINGEYKVPGFRSFIIQTFATNCCLYSILDSSFDFRDANTLVLFGEIVAAQKVMYEKFGDEFVIHFIYKALPAARCPQDLAEQYYQKLKGSDIKALKSVYQSLVEKLRQQQDGSLVFR